MKKSRLLALTLVVALMLVGAGYAYWQDALTINTTVDTGNLEVKFQEPADVNGEKEPPYQPNADCRPVNNGKEMQVTFKEAYPGLRNDLEFTLANVGTLKAYVDEFKIASTGAPYFNTNLIRCNGIEIGGVKTSFTDGTLAEAFAFINNHYDGNKGIAVDTELKDRNSDNYYYTAGTTKVKFALQFDQNANDTNFKQDDNTIDKDVNYSFKITAQVYQFNEKEAVAN